ncbi:MAG: universal stress protein [Polyangiaceae bacterium]|nr:universal stress protein [Polyangiaceae bacterium]
MKTSSLTPSVRRVLTAVDDDPASDEALVAGDWLARTFGAHLGVVHVLPGFPGRGNTPQRANGEGPDRGVITAQIEDLTAHVSQRTGRTSSAFEVFIDRGPIEDEIVERANMFAADIIVVGTHGRHGVDRVVAGSVAELVVRRAPCPVFVARPSPRDGRIIAACDLAQSTPLVLRWAGAISQRAGGTILATHTVEMAMSDVALVATTIFGGAVPPQPDAESAQALRTAATGALRAELTGASVIAETEVLTGPATTMVSARARDLGASLIVCGTHGRKGLSRLALGSVAETLVRHAPCSVLVVR